MTKKSLSAAPARLQRMILRLQRYDYSITYKPGKDMTLADSLSRLPKTNQDEEIKLELKVAFVQFSRNKIAQLQQETSKDSELGMLKKHVVDGFPERAKSIHPSLREYWNFRDEISMENGLVLKGERVVIPESLRQEFLAKIHEGHQGITRCQQRAKSTVFWPGINDEIKRMVQVGAGDSDCQC